MNSNRKVLRQAGRDIRSAIKRRVNKELTYILENWTDRLGFNTIFALIKKNLIVGGEWGLLPSDVEFFKDNIRMEKGDEVIGNDDWTPTYTAVHPLDYEPNPKNLLQPYDRPNRKTVYILELLPVES